jgi:hypothetical protein
VGNLGKKTYSSMENRSDMWKGKLRLFFEGFFLGFIGGGDFLF